MKNLLRYRSGVFFGLAVAFSGSLLWSAPAEAASFTINFCPADGTCPANVLEASLTFDEILTGTDPNDYILTVRIVGTTGEPVYIDAVNFKIDGTSITSYEVQPSLISAPVTVPPGYTWVVVWDQVSNSPQACLVDTQNGTTGLCANSPNFSGTTTDGVNEWVFLVDLVDSLGPLQVGDVVNLRAEFDTTNGGNGGILSPGGGGLTLVPEPTSLTLLGAGLALTGYRLRRRKMA